MSEGPDARLDDLLGKARSVGLTEQEAEELADLQRGGPAPVPSKLLAPRQHVRPWRREYWRGRALGPLGALLVIAGVVIAVVVVSLRRPSIDWRIYEDPAFTFKIEYPNGWTTTPLSERAPARKGRPARRVDAVAVIESGPPPDSLGAVFAQDNRGPAYGFIVYEPAVGELVVQAPPAGTPGRAVRIAGLDGLEYDSTLAGIVTRVTYARVGDRLVVFFARAPQKRAGDLAAIVDHARDSIGLSQGLETTVSPPRATRGG